MLLRAFAKINLELRILGRREDGYHEIQTVLQTIDWYDEIHLTRAERFEFFGPGTPEDETNLVVRAVRAYERLSKSPAPVRIRLMKNVPIGRGLGGGSSDAATTLMGLWANYPIAVAPAMGSHLVDTTGPEFSGTPFTRTWIYGVYDGRITFYEEMVALEYMLSKPNACSTFKTAAAVDTTGYYPTESCVRYDAASDTYNVSLEKFVMRERSEPTAAVKVPPPGPPPAPAVKKP